MKKSAGIFPGADRARRTGKATGLLGHRVERMPEIFSKIYLRYCDTGCGNIMRVAVVIDILDYEKKCGNIWMDQLVVELPDPMF